MPASGPRWTLLRGRLVRRLVLAFCLASALPVLIASAIAYSELVGVVNRQQDRALREEAKSAGMNLLGQLQLVKAALELPPPPHADEGRLPGGMGRILYRHADSPLALRSHVPGLDAKDMPQLVSGETVLRWNPRSGEEPALELLTYLAAEQRLAIARLDPERLSAVSLASGGDLAMAIVFSTDGTRISDKGGVLDRGTGRHWRTAEWMLPLSGEFAAPPLKIVIGAPARYAAADTRLFKVVVPLLLATAVALAVWLATAVLRRQLGPLQILTAATRRIARRDFNVQLEISTDDEFAQLARDFNSMAGNLRSQFSTLESLAEVDRLLLKAPTLENILDALLPRMADILGTDRIGVLLADPGSPGYAQVHEHDHSGGSGCRVRRIQLQDALPWSFDLADAATHSRLATMVFGEPAAATTHFQPLRQGGCTAGSLCLCWLPGSMPDPEREPLERDLADRLSVALGNLSHEQELLHRARFDGLTRLANRDYFIEVLDQRIAQALAEAGKAALLYIDLDGFKKINDSAGHDAGDRVLVEIAARLRRCAGPLDMVARLGGDEFAVIADASDAASPDRLAEELRRVLQEPVEVSGLERPMSASIGLARIPEDGTSSHALLRNADLAMYKAKEHGRDRVVAFQAAMLEQMNERVGIEIGLQAAIGRNELSLAYQPIVAVAGEVSAEALLRWTRSDGTAVSPAQFIPVAEQSGLINVLGLWALERACIDFAAWRAHGLAPAYVSINVAPRQLQSGDFLSRAERIVTANGLRTSDVQLEITESAIADGPGTRSMIHLLSRRGFRMAMDDFGTGYSSLSTLHEYPFNVVKIDRSFVSGLPHNPVALRLVDAIIRMAHGLEKYVVAEGVETEAQKRALLDLGCDAMQGYLFARPADSAAFRECMRARQSIGMEGERAAGRSRFSPGASSAAS